MIRRLSPALAAVPSSYGHPFSRPLPLLKRARETLDRHCRSVVPLPLLFASKALRESSSLFPSQHPRLVTSTGWELMRSFAP